jgi:LmbE family N-acetylglucosaminyl deacetylase
MAAETGERNLKVLAIHAHPDDVEFTCAGTLALLAERGCSIVIATLSPGDLGSVDLPPREIAGVPEDVWNFHIGGYQVCEK